MYVFSLQVTHLFDNGGTVFFAIFMAIWGKYIFICFVLLVHLTLLYDYWVKGDYSSQYNLKKDYDFVTQSFFSCFHQLQFQC